MDQRGELALDFIMIDILHFQGKHMPDGRESNEGEKLTLENVSPKHAGTYKCTADNGNGNPVSNRIIVNIEYKPTVEPRQGQMTQPSAGQKLSTPSLSFVFLSFPICLLKKVFSVS